MRSVVVYVFCAALLMLSACTLPKLRIPRVHKVTVQQGNVITQTMINKLKPGMTRSQVAFIMGEPVMRNTFDERRWDYIYTVEVPGLYEEDKRVTLIFENDLLAQIAGDLAPTASTPVDEPAVEEPTTATTQSNAIDNSAELAGRAVPN